jgi:tetratricopeptide (TPR) repeat protein
MKDRRVATALLGAGLVVRLAAIVAAKDHPLVASPIMDARGYHLWAADIASGNVLGAEVFYQAPLYPYLLGAVYAIFGVSVPAALALNVLLETAALAILHAAARRLFGATAACATLALGVAYGLFLFDVVQVGKSSLDLLLVAALVHALITADARRAGSPADGAPPRPAPAYRWLRVGAVLGLGALNRGNLLLVAPPLALRAALRAGPSARARAAAPLALAAGLAAAVAPVTARNVLVAHDLVLTSAHGGFNFYLGNHERADGASKRVPFVRENPEHEPYDALEVASRAMGRPLRQSEVSSWWTRRALAWIAGHPGDALRLYIRKLHLLTSAYELPDSLDPRFLAQRVPFLGLPWVTYGLVLPLGLLGLALARRDRRPSSPIPLLLVAFTASLLPFYVFARYRLPLVPLLMIPAGHALVALGQALRSRSRAALAGLALLPAMALVHATPSGIDTTLSVSEANLGNLLAQQGRLPEALAEYDRALAERPSYTNARYGRSAVLRRLGRKKEAESELHAVLAAEPENWFALYDVGRLLLERGENDAAARAFAEATRIWPAEAPLHFAHGVALRRLGRPREAATAFRDALARDAAFDEARWNLALLLFDLGERGAARSELRALLARKPGDAEATAMLQRFEDGATEPPAAAGAPPTATTPRAPASPAVPR